MLKIAFALALVVYAGAAHAQSRPSTTNMSCAAASAIIRSQGAAVLGTGGDTFDRFVRDASFCARGQVLLPGFAPAADNRQCLVGWRCFDETKDNR